MRDLARRARRTTWIAFAGTGALFLVKGAAGVLSGSIALISDALNSLVDIVTMAGISYSVAVARRAPDADHPFGHQRAEPLAALGVAIFTGILGFSIGRAAVERLLAGPAPIRQAGWALGALAVSIVGSVLLARYLRRRGEELDSPAILAAAVENANDVLASFAALIGVGGAALGMPEVDPAAGLFVGGWIILGGYRFGRQNIDYLMGKSPRPELLARIEAAAREVDGVRGVHDVRAHHVGHRVHVEVHVEVDEELRMRQAHDVGGAARHAIERLPGIDRAFVHVDPVLDSAFVVETLGRAERAASAVYAAYARAHREWPALASLWEALATQAQARAERLAVVRRLKGAGWYFADGDVPPDRVEARQARLEEWLDRAARAAIPRGAALAVALEIESPAWRQDVQRAAVPQDPTLATSLDGAVPPPPPVDLLRRRIAAARLELPAEGERERLDALERALGVPA